MHSVTLKAILYYLEIDTLFPQDGSRNGFLLLRLLRQFFFVIFHNCTGVRKFTDIRFARFARLQKWMNTIRYEMI